MRVMILVPAAIAAMLAFNISAASSQEACMGDYQACMGSCATKPSKTMQDGCFQSCENKNNLCAERVYGKRPFNGGPASASAEPKAPAKDAMAKKERLQEATQEQAEARAPQQDQAPAPAAPAPRAPAKR